MPKTELIYHTREKLRWVRQRERDEERNNRLLNLFKSLQRARNYGKSVAIAIICSNRRFTLIFVVRLRDYWFIERLKESQFPAIFKPNLYNCDDWRLGIYLISVSMEGKFVCHNQSKVDIYNNIEWAKLYVYVCMYECVCARESETEDKYERIT